MGKTEIELDIEFPRGEWPALGQHRVTWRGKRMSIRKRAVWTALDRLVADAVAEAAREARRAGRWLG